MSSFTTAVRRTPKRTAASANTSRTSDTRPGQARPFTADTVAGVVAISGPARNTVQQSEVASKASLNVAKLSRRTVTAPVAWVGTSP